MQETALHINAKELLGAMYSTQALLLKEQQETILIQTDNQVVVSYINKQGGKIHHISAIAEEFWKWCLTKGHSLQAKYLAGQNNTRADRLSRQHKDRTGWMLNPQIFQKLYTIWVPCQVDLFASRTNTQLPVFLSRLPDPKAFACNAFLNNWSTWKYLYANPPWNMIGRVLQRLLDHNHHGEMILITPWWKSAPWWPLLQKMALEPPLILPNLEGKLCLYVDESLPALQTGTHTILLAARISSKLHNRVDLIPRLLPY